MTTSNEMLRALGYATSSSGITEFQRDFNRLGTRPVLVTGVLDEQTLAALELAHESASVFQAVRDQGRR